MAFEHVREIAAAPADVFAAFTDPARHARWWGPAGFTNTFHRRDFRTGGRWVYVMHGPDGRSYDNESVFEEVTPTRIAIRHVSNPQYNLTIELAPSPKGTMVSWSQAFETERIETRLAQIVGPANEENLDRLTAEVIGAKGWVK